MSEVPIVQMNEIEKKINFFCVGFLEKVKILNFIERKCESLECTCENVHS